MSKELNKTYSTQTIRKVKVTGHQGKASEAVDWCDNNGYTITYLMPRSERKRTGKFRINAYKIVSEVVDE